MPYRKVLENNRRWVGERTQEDPTFFKRLVAEHRPHFLWIGCSDARVPANEITQTAHGEMFVHRNIANLVVPTDANLLAVLQYAVEVLKVEDVIVCGHEQCGGVKASLGPAAPPAVEQWLSNIRMIARLYDEELSAIEDEGRRTMRLVELNVTEQVFNLARTSVVQEAWARGATLRLHGWVYTLSEGRLYDLGVSLDGSTAADVAAGAVRRTAPRGEGVNRIAADVQLGDAPPPR
jgi:carbonic anhydrase